MKNLYDVLVIGGGPVGSYAARLLAEKGFTVCVLEQKEKVGEGVICTGVISKECFEKFGLPREAILKEIKSLIFISPNDQHLEYIVPYPLAYVINRELFDHLLAAQAQKSGAQFKLGVYAREITEHKRYYRVTADGNEFYAKFVIIATGVNYRFQKRLGLGTPPRFLYGSQVVLHQKKDVDSNIEIYLGQRYCPGSFAWVVPVDKNLFRIGTILSIKGKEYLKRFIEERLGYDGVLMTQQIESKSIAHGALKRSVQGKILVVGEAAGQVKTTTGGGIFTGLLCAEIAIDYLTSGLKYGKPLDEYDVTWRSLLSVELDIGRRIRSLASKINDKTIERLFSFVKHNRFWIDLVLPKINFDFHSDLLNFCLKSFSHLLKIT
ncbi:MAG: NAD(P)/FAD-dependent oxidoreductase [candidate division WOR-3 bacterium]